MSQSCVVRLNCLVILLDNTQQEGGGREGLEARGERGLVHACLVRDNPDPRWLQQHLKTSAGQHEGSPRGGTDHGSGCLHRPGAPPAPQRANSWQAGSAHGACTEVQQVHAPWPVKEGLAVRTLRTAARHVGGKAATAIAVQTIGWSDMRQPHTETKAALRL